MNELRKCMGCPRYFAIDPRNPNTTHCDIMCALREECKENSLRRPVFCCDEIESMIVSLGEEIPDDYQSSDCDLMWEVIGKFVKQLREKQKERTLK